jgi:hypothetical protein
VRFGGSQGLVSDQLAMPGQQRFWVTIVAISASSFRPKPLALVAKRRR